MSAEELAQVIEGHRPGVVAREGGFLCVMPGCGYRFRLAQSQREHAAHLAAVVLAHLTAEGWAQGREDQWGVKFMHPADQRVSPATTREHADLMLEGLREHYGPHVDLAVVRRRVTDWEPAD